MQRKLALLFLASLISACGNGSLGGNGGKSAEALVCPSGPTLTGSDVSAYQANTNWFSVKQAGNSFAFVKATEGTGYTNPDFDTDWVGIHNAGLVRGAYHFFHPGDDPVALANFFLSVVGTLHNGDLPPMLDWEVTDGQPWSVVFANTKAWLDQVEQATGRTPVIYTYSAFFGAQPPAEFSRYPLFIADYGPSCPSVPAPWNSWVLWQYADHGAVPGDADKFNGTLADLMTFTMGGPPLKPIGQLPPSQGDA